MEALSQRELPIPKHFDIFHLTNEIDPSDKTALECVMEVNEERHLLEIEADQLASRQDDEMAHDRLVLYLKSKLSSCNIYVYGHQNCPSFSFVTVFILFCGTKILLF